jgi:hypothetical protein
MSIWQIIKSIFYSDIPILKQFEKLFLDEEKD